MKLAAYTVLQVKVLSVIKFNLWQYKDYYAVFLGGGQERK